MAKDDVTPTPAVLANAQTADRAPVTESVVEAPAAEPLAPVEQPVQTPDHIADRLAENVSPMAHDMPFKFGAEAGGRTDTPADEQFYKPSEQ